MQQPLLYNNSEYDKRQRGESCLLSGELYMNNRVWQINTNQIR